jgi:hypothetical protein
MFTQKDLSEFVFAKRLACRLLSPATLRPADFAAQAAG